MTITFGKCLRNVEGFPNKDVPDQFTLTVIIKIKTVESVWTKYLRDRFDVNFH